MNNYKYICYEQKKQEVFEHVKPTPLKSELKKGVMKALFESLSESVPIIIKEITKVKK